jgi:hypothetical protein
MITKTRHQRSIINFFTRMASLVNLIANYSRYHKKTINKILQMICNTISYRAINTNNNTDDRTKSKITKSSNKQTTTFVIVEGHSLIFNIYSIYLDNDRLG